MQVPLASWRWSRWRPPCTRRGMRPGGAAGRSWGGEGRAGGAGARPQTLSCPACSRARSLVALCVRCMGASPYWYQTGCFTHMVTAECCTCSLLVVCITAVYGVARRVLSACPCLPSAGRAGVRRRAAPRRPAGPRGSRVRVRSARPGAGAPRQSPHQHHRGQSSEDMDRAEMETLKTHAQRVWRGRDRLGAPPPAGRRALGRGRGSGRFIHLR